MAPRTVTLCYRKIIDAQATRPWDKLVFDGSYAEFRLQAQYYNQDKRYRAYGELRQHVPGADKLPFLVSGAVVGYVRQLNGTVPDVADNLGRLFLKFENFQFELINSDLHDANRHVVAVNFYSQPLHWHDTIAPYLLVSDAAAVPDAAGALATHLFQLQPYVSVHALHSPA